MIIGIFGKKKSHSAAAKFDSAKYKPVIRCSICTGEQVAGFKDITSGKFEDIMLIRNENDLESFMETYGIENITKEY